jgi:hypothetical protein
VSKLTVTMSAQVREIMRIGISEFLDSIRDGELVEAEMSAGEDEVREPSLPFISRALNGTKTLIVLVNGGAKDGPENKASLPRVPI